MGQKQARGNEDSHEEMRYAPAIILLLSAASLTGCVATTNEIADLRDDIYQLQLKLNDMQKNQADLSVKMDAVSGKMSALNSELEDNQNRMSVLGTRLDDVDSNLSQKMNKLSEQMSGQALTVSPPPSEIYKLAYGDFSRGKYDLSITGFRAYLDKFPSGELASQAQYYLGECYYAQNNWEKAAQEFGSVEKKYPKSGVVPAARLKNALALGQSGKAGESRAMLETLIKDFPESPEAYSAKEKISPSDANEQRP
ncbi:MAG: tol-pal system protein YbgF [Elusimicrobiota bacterium]